MLHIEAVTPELKRTLDSLMEWRELDQFCLVGGTSLALRFGFRESDDIDLFTSSEYDSSAMSQRLELFLPGCNIESVSKGSITAYYEGIKLDILQHVYKEVAQQETIDGIRLSSIPDISAMKINAVSRRGSKKDFSDLLYLHQNGTPLLCSVQNYESKYGESGLFSAVKSLTYFEDTKGEPDPRYRNGWTWAYVRQEMNTLGQEVQMNYNQMWELERQRSHD